MEDLNKYTCIPTKDVFTSYKYSFSKAYSFVIKLINEIGTPLIGDVREINLGKLLVICQVLLALLFQAVHNYTLVILK
jgi:hypothetical protein